MKTCDICHKQFANMSAMTNHAMMHRRRKEELERQSGMISNGDVVCFYGCGNKAIVFLKNSHPCCCLSANQCPAVRKNNSEKHAGKHGWKIHPRGMLGRPAWNKGIQLSKECKEKISASLMGKHCTPLSKEREEQRREKIRDFIKRRYASGWMPRAGRCKKISYVSPICGEVKIDGSWELEFARFLDSKGVVWERNKKRFVYFFNNTERHYTPDFYLQGFDVFVEVKGYVTTMDKSKWSQFPNRLRVVGRTEINRIKKGNLVIDDIIGGLPESGNGPVC